MLVTHSLGIMGLCNQRQSSVHGHYPWQVKSTWHGQRGELIHSFTVSAQLFNCKMSPSHKSDIYLERKVSKEFQSHATGTKSGML